MILLFDFSLSQSFKLHTEPSCTGSLLEITNYFTFVVIMLKLNCQVFGQKMEIRVSV